LIGAILKKFASIFTKYKLWLLAFLKPLGFWGVGCLALIDAAAIPVPQDLILAGYVWQDKKHFYVYVLVSSLGSAIGGLVPFLLGRAGGELFLMKRINRARFERLRDQFEKQEFLAMMIPSILPPPTPWKLFVFGAGVFEMKLVDFMLAVFVGRVLRNLITAVLAIEYGPLIVTRTAALAAEHKRAAFALLVVLVGALVAWFLRKRRGKDGGDIGGDEEIGVREQGSSAGL
jgi:membrane protein YqaA with SNARE-associated domain